MDTETNNNEPAQAPESTEIPKTGGEQTDAKQNTENKPDYRTFAILGYILPFLFFLPLIDDKTKDVPFARFHANQQLILLVIIIGASILHSFLFSMLMSLGYFVAQMVNLAIIALAVIGAFNAYNGKMKELPFVGQFRILK